jgi:universal stress protein E
MTTSEKLFVCVNPSDEVHDALQRSIITAGLRTPSPAIHVFVGVDGESVDTRACNDSLTRDQSWFEDVIRRPLEESGLEYVIEVCWCYQWQESIVRSAKSVGASSILLSIPSKVSYRRLTFSESKWNLLKEAGCPVILVRPGASERRKVVLAAVNFQALREEQKELNVRLLAHARWFAENYGADFHVVNAYRDSLNYPDRGKLARETGLPPEHIHVRLGYTDEVVSEVAKELSADLVVMGTLGQNGMTKARRGNTAHRVIAGLDMDVMVMN